MGGIEYKNIDVRVSKRLNNWLLPIIGIMGIGQKVLITFLKKVDRQNI